MIIFLITTRGVYVFLLPVCVLMGSRLGSKSKILARARYFQDHQTRHETLMAVGLEEIGISYRSQFVVHPYILDFFLPEYKLAIEVDGDSHKRQMEYDQRRSRRLSKKGIKVIRFLNADVEFNMVDVVKTIKSTVDTREIYLRNKFSFEAQCFCGTKTISLDDYVCSDCGSIFSV